MSRIGKQPVVIPPEVKVEWNPPRIRVQGPRGELSREIKPGIELTIEDNLLRVKRRDDERQTRSLHGLYRSLIKNMVDGVTAGFEKRLEVMGVGYRAEVKGRELHMLLGFSHPVAYLIPEGIEVNSEKGFITVRGIDKEKVGQVAAEIRSFRPPEPYKGKGIRYADELLRRKAGKAAVGTGT
jgi:large subunit ribosomal protein L6